jgi:hypothetical protein
LVERTERKGSLRVRKEKSMGILVKLNRERERGRGLWAQCPSSPLDTDRTEEGGG